jgi:RNA-directed DNA polymerase
MAFNFRNNQLEKWLKIRKYSHFDNKVSLDFAKKYVQDANQIETHSFLPFLKYIDIKPRYQSKEKKVRFKERPILYGGHLDSHIYAWYSYQLNQDYEKIIQEQEINKSVLAYRTLSKCNIDFSKEIFDEIEQRSPCTALAFDISGFFDNIDHQRLKQAWCKVLGVTELPLHHYKVYKSITNYSYVDLNSVFKEFKISREQLQGKNRICSSQEFRERVRGKGLIQKNKSTYGIPQGSPISAVLSNIFLINFDKLMAQYAHCVDGIYRRYCDDILWICPHEYAEDVKSFVDEEVRKCGDTLFINSDKTEISEFRMDNNNRLVGTPPLQYLGFTFDGQYRLLRSETLARYYCKMKAAVRATVTAALRSGTPQVYRKSLYEKYSHLGRNNFITYAYRSAEGMKSKAIRRQIRRHWKKLHKEIEKGLS